MRKILSSVILILLVITGCTAASQSYYISVNPVSTPDAMAYYTSGVTLASQGMHREAIDQFKKAVAADPFFSEAYLSLSKSYFAINNYDFAIFYNIRHYELEDMRDYTYNYRLDLD